MTVSFIDPLSNMQFQIDIHNVQAIKRLSLQRDLSQNKIMCVVGRNGIGKTTLIRSIKNLSQSDAFLRTAPSGIFSSDSVITYSLNGERITFTFDQRIDSLNCKENMSPAIHGLCAAELPIPHGDRFNFFQSISKMDRHIRHQIIREEYDRPRELIDFLSDIYSSDRFQSLVEIKINDRNYYCILLDNGRYIREDYLSSGEYFLIRLYQTIVSPARLVVVDEIDISLDAVAQVKLLRKLREYCTIYKCNVLFTTHSLAMMRTLNDDELYYMERCDEETRLAQVSYSYVKSLLFAFDGWDRYILTEDRVLASFLETLIRLYFPSLFFKYKVIHVGGASQVVDLLERNRSERFFSEPENVVAVLDGDQRTEKCAQVDGVYVLPFDNVEKELYKYYQEDNFPCKLPKGMKINGPKHLFDSLQKKRVMSEEEIYESICDRNKQDLVPLIEVLSGFLTQDKSRKEG